VFQQLGVTLYAASAWVVPLVIAITFHEASHGYVARLCGDDTAWRLGRVSFNPLKHIDPFGTVVHSTATDAFLISLHPSVPARLAAPFAVDAHTSASIVLILRPPT
jgi:Zn-dependent protease